MAEVKIGINAAELIYLMQEQEGSVLPGITDPYAALDDVDRSQLILECEDSLREKELRKRAFGGIINYNQDLYEMMQILVHFDHYIGIDYRKANEKLVTERFYEHDGRWVALSGTSDALFLSMKGAADIKNILHNLPTDSGSKSNHIAILIPKQEFKGIGYLVETGNFDEVKEKIMAYDVDEYNKQFLLDGVSFMTDFATITIVLRKNDGISVQSVSALIREDAMAEFYQTENEDYSTMIGLRSVSTGTWMELRGVAEKWLTV